MLLLIAEKEQDMPMHKFEKFWALYPKKRSKGDARKAWEQHVIESIHAEKIFKTINLFKEHDDWKRDNGKYIPYPATFLRREMWEDETEIEVKEEKKQSIAEKFGMTDEEYKKAMEGMYD